MRVRNFREVDISDIYTIQQAAHLRDALPVVGEEELRAALLDPLATAAENIFVITDDDDELQTWGEAGMLIGLEGPIIGYTWVRYLHDHEGHHFRCTGAVLPDERGKGAGRALLISALNRARYLATDIDTGTAEENEEIYFEVVFPVREQADSVLTTICELQWGRRESVYVGTAGTAMVDIYRRALEY